LDSWRGRKTGILFYLNLLLEINLIVFSACWYLPFYYIKLYYLTFWLYKNAWWFLRRHHADYIKNACWLY
jgi:hypothetical protein